MTTPIIHKVIPGSRTGAPSIEVGERALLTTSQSNATIYSVTSGRKFKFGSIIATNHSGDAILTIYDDISTVSNRVLELVLGALKTQVIGPDELMGVKECVSAVTAFATHSAVFLSVGGVEY